MIQNLVVQSPAKINWFLHITGQRENGYHELQTLFQFISLYDELSFTQTLENTIELTGDTAGVSKTNNLIYKAAEKLIPYKKTELGIQIHCNKQIPMGGGLGGGSSNAATCLLVLNKLWNCGLTQTQLMEIGVSLGADVPVFVNGQTAFAEGIGEFLYDTKQSTQYLLIALPENCHISTQDIFGEENLCRNTAKIDFEQYQFAKTHNDCQPIATSRFPLVAKTLDWLLEYAPSRMTGTGACSFAVFSSKNEALKVQKTAPNGIQTWVVETLQQSPVLKNLNLLLK